MYSYAAIIFDLDVKDFAANYYLRGISGLGGCGMHSPRNASATPCAFNSHIFGYVCPSTPHTGSQIVAHTMFGSRRVEYVATSRSFGGLTTAGSDDDDDGTDDDRDHTAPVIPEAACNTGACA